MNPKIDTTTHFQRVKNLITHFTITHHTHEPLIRLNGHSPTGTIATLAFKSEAQAKGYVKYSGATNTAGEELQWNQTANNTLTSEKTSWL